MPSLFHSLSLTLFAALLLFTTPTFSADPPEASPSPSPQLPPQAISPPPEAPAPSPAFLLSPPAPPPSVPAPDSPSPAPSSPSPAPDVVADGGEVDQSNVGDVESKDNSSGMSGVKKFGIAIGVIAGCCVVGAAALLYMKRQQNIRRAQYGHAARADYM